ncbi:MAG TPA: hypothetical protein VKZ50_01460 [bacterium]|nr:hypothetical protein [bacterium]
MRFHGYSPRRVPDARWELWFLGAGGIALFSAYLSIASQLELLPAWRANLAWWLSLFGGVTFCAVAYRMGYRDGYRHGTRRAEHISSLKNRGMCQVDIDELLRRRLAGDQDWEMDADGNYWMYPEEKEGPQ